MKKQSSFCVPVCVRDGEPLVKISVAGIEFQMGIGEFRDVIGCVRMDICNATGPVRRTIGRFLKIARDVCNIVCSLSPPGKPEEAEKNRKRWAETGIGGVQKLEPIEDRLAELSKAIRQDWAVEREKFIERASRLFPHEDGEED